MPKGQCHCGAVKYEMSTNTVHQALCHCSDCRRNSGAPMVAWGLVTKDELKVEGETREYASSEHGRRHFCPNCGTGLFYTSEAIFPARSTCRSRRSTIPTLSCRKRRYRRPSESDGWKSSTRCRSSSATRVRKGNRLWRLRKVPTVVPNIPVIHRLEHALFASPTRRRGALFKGDRDGSPRLHRKARKGQKEAEGDGRTDLRRQAMRNSSEVRRASREEAPEELIFL